MDKKEIPIWQKNFVLFSESYPIIQLHGCIEDMVPYCADNAPDRYMNLDEWLWRTCRRVPSTLLVFYSALNGFSNSYSDADLNEFNRLGGNGRASSLSEAARKIINAYRGTTDKRIVVVFDSTIRCLTAGPVIAPDDQRAFTSLKAAIMNNSSSLRHQLIFINEKSSDLPQFLMATQSSAKSIVLPMPDQVLRFNYLKTLFSQRNLPEEQLYSVAQNADNLTLKEIKVALSKLDSRTCTPREMSETIKLFKLGFSEDPWSLINREKIDNAEEILSNQIFGQEEAVRTAATLLQAAASGFSSVFQEDGKTAPKGTLFLCGLTGTGKTELAKAIARLAFGSADAIVRFDMGEFIQEHSSERLTGSPPGYVGHNEGGQLTEAIKAHPFSLVLFDEIEKAHPSIFNKFLSILDDGRLTDGKGETVSFENNIIVFTSNLGASEAISLSNPDDVKETIMKAVKDFCELPPPHGIGKPELYSRLAGNIVVFNPLSEEILNRIYEKKLQDIKDRLASQRSVTLVHSDVFEEKLRALVKTHADSGEFPGGRGVKKAIETYYLTPLQAFVQVERCQDGDTITIDDLVVERDNVSLVASVRHAPVRTPRPAPSPAPSPSPAPAPPRNPSRNPSRSPSRNPSRNPSRTPPRNSSSANAPRTGGFSVVSRTDNNNNDGGNT